MTVPRSEARGLLLLALLTPREGEIMHWVANGKSNWETAQILGCSEQTVKKHLQRVYRKLGVENRTAAALVFTHAEPPAS